METLSVIRLGWPISNVWLLPRTEIGPVLIDSGMSLLWPLIERGLERHGFSPRDLGAVLLTHLHSDHAGNAARLSSRFDVPVYAHPADGDVLGGRSPRIGMPVDGLGVEAVFCRIENRFPARRLQTRPLNEGDEVAGMEVYSMPGHTKGSVFLYHRRSGTLFTGDTLLNGTPPLITRTRLCLPHPPFCWNHELAIESLRRFVELDVDVQTLCSGHGPKRSGALRPAVERLLDAELRNRRHLHSHTGTMPEAQPASIGL